MENVHEGHRKRLRQRFLSEGLESFEPHNVLELLLFYTNPRIDTNELAHRLIERFGSLAGVFNAHVDELVKVRGLGESGAVLLHLVPQLLRVYSLDNHDRAPLDTARRMCDYCMAAFLGTSVEEVRVICLDDTLRVISNTIISEGAFSNVSINARRIVDVAFRSRSDLLILAHNHPNGKELPSEQDEVATRQIFKLLKALGMTLLDHIVVGGTNAFSMRDGGYFYDL